MSTARCTITIGDDLVVRRIGYGAMQLTGKQVWGEYPDREAGIALLREAVEAGVTFIDTADVYGPHSNELLIREALHPYPDDLVIATKGGFVRGGYDYSTLGRGGQPQLPAPVRAHQRAPARRRPDRPVLPAQRPSHGHALRRPGRHPRRAARTLTQKNVYRQTDYLSFLVTLKQEGLLLQQLEIQFRNDHGMLNYLCGIVDTTATSLEDPGIQLQTLPDVTGSVFFRQFHLDSLKLRNDRSLVDFSYKPKANLFADGGYSSSLAYQAYKNFGMSFGVSVTVPIYDGHQRRLQYGKLDIQERTRSGYKNFFTKQYNQQIAQLTQQLKGTEELIGQINDQVRYSEALIEANGKLLGTGDAKIADYILALSNYLNAKNLLTQNNITRLQIINQINYWNR